MNTLDPDNPLAQFAAKRQAQAGTAITAPQTVPADTALDPAAPPPAASRPAPKRPPRKRKPATDKVVSVRMKNAVYEQLHDVAHQNNIHLATYVRAALQKYAADIPKRTSPGTRRLRAADTTRYSLKLSPEQLSALADVADTSGHPQNTVVVYSITQALNEGFVPVLEDDWV